MAAKPFFPRSSRVLVGAMVALVAAGLTYAQATSIRDQTETLRWVEQNRSPSDSAMYASALYHASYAQGMHAGRWGLTGYMTLGAFGVVAGAALALTALRKDRLQQPDREAA